MLIYDTDTELLDIDCSKSWTLTSTLLNKFLIKHSVYDKKLAPPSRVPFLVHLLFLKTKKIAFN